MEEATTEETSIAAEASAAAGDPAPEPSEPTSAPPERIAPQSSLSGSARDQVNADGTLQQPPARGPLAGLREKLGG